MAMSKTAPMIAIMMMMMIVYMTVDATKLLCNATQSSSPCENFINRHLTVFVEGTIANRCAARGGSARDVGGSRAAD